jgi:hypothetical protein
VRYFKATISYEITQPEDGAQQQGEQALYCCTPHIPKLEQLHKLFCSLPGNDDKKYLGAFWRSVKKEDIPDDAGTHHF